MGMNFHVFNILSGNGKPLPHFYFISWKYCESWIEDMEDQKNGN